jgi:hypothetical protein
MRQNLSILHLACAGLLGTTLAQADVSDPAAARAQLQQGYALKQQGKCVDAIPHFAESVRLDRQPKALLNLADCEAKTAKLVSAQAHAVEARDLARARAMPDFEKFAIGQLKELDERMPKLVITVAKSAPTGTVVARDGVELGAISLSTPLPIDPGAHKVVARGGGFERTFPFVLAERETKTIDVTPIGGTPLPTPQVSQGMQTPPDRKAETSPGSESGSEATTAPFLSGQRIAALGLAGVGLVGFGVSYALASSARKSWKSAVESCPNNVCTDSADVDQAASARKQGNVATIVFGIGAASLVTGGILWFTGHRQDTAAVQVTPQVSASFGGVSLGGQF